MLPPKLLPLWLVLSHVSPNPNDTDFEFGICFVEPPRIQGWIW
jgi:hypothetical protein